MHRNCKDYIVGTVLSLVAMLSLVVHDSMPVRNMIFPCRTSVITPIKEGRLQSLDWTSGLDW